MEYKVTDEHINEYISGELTGNNLIEFEKLLAKDEDLQQQIKVHKQIDTVLSDNYFEVNRFNREEHQNEKERLNSIFNKMNQKYFLEEEDREKKINDGELKVIKEEKNTPENTYVKKSIVRRLLPFVTLAAAAALLLFVFNPSANNLSSPQLADQYFESYTTGTLMGEEDHTLENSPKAILKKGSQQYQDNQFEEAIQTFKKVTINKYSLVYENKANWYIALCYLKLDKPQAAKPLLRQLKQSTDYADKAKEILKDLG